MVQAGIVDVSEKIRSALTASERAPPRYRSGRDYEPGYQSKIFQLRWGLVDGFTLELQTSGTRIM